MKNIMRKFGIMLRKFIICLSILTLFAVSFTAVIAQDSAQVGMFDGYQVAPGGRVEVPIEIRGVQDLYAIDIELSFDPVMLGAEDADPSMSGIQPALGTFLDAGLLLYDSIDLEKGIIRFAMSQVNPSEGKSGDGILLVVYFVGKTAGESFLTVNSVTLSDRLGNEIPASGVAAKITVSEGAAAVTSTSIPVQDPTNIIIISTLAPTPTNTLVPTETPIPTSTAVPEVTSTPKSAGGDTEPSSSDVSGEVEEKGGSWLSQSWWIILLAALGIGGVGVYFSRNKKRADEKKRSDPPTY